MNRYQRLTAPIDGGPFLWVIAILTYAALIVSSFYNDDSPVQFRCDRGNAYTAAGVLEHPLERGDCRLVIP